MRLSIVVIGDEILLGQVTDTNSGEIARTLGPMGWQVVETRVVGDGRESILAAVESAMSQSDLVITTGGLGPTKDDVTKSVLMECFGGELREDAASLENVKRVFERRGIKLNALTLAQAMVPSSCRVIVNRYGTAPIMWFERDGKVLVAMPGVPFETVGMLHDVVADEIRRHFQSDECLLHHTLIVSGLSESALAERLDGYERALPPTMHLAYLPVPGYIRLRLDGRLSHADEAAARDFTQDFDRQVDRLKAELGKYLIYDGDATPAQILLERLGALSLTVATAESCTGGNIAHRLTLVPGSSEHYLGTVVSYSNSVKEGVLGVSSLDLATEGAVSEPVVRQMAQGVAHRLGADCAIATSGIAGPGGGSETKPVGTVWIGVHTPGGTEARLYHLPGGRERVIDRATTEGLLLLIAKLS